MESWPKLSSEYDFGVYLYEQKFLTTFLFISSRDANWSPELRSNKVFTEFLTDIGLDMNEIHIAIDIYNYIEERGEMGVSAIELLERYEDKAFLQTLLNHMNDAKFVMKTGVCELTYVHSKHIKPWVINTYHLKRLNRVSKLAA